MSRQLLVVLTELRVMGTFMAISICCAERLLSKLADVGNVIKDDDAVGVGVPGVRASQGWVRVVGTALWGEPLVVLSARLGRSLPLTPFPHRGSANIVGPSVRM